MNVYDTLKSLNIELPPVAVPAAAYVPFVQTGNLVFLSGHIAKKRRQGLGRSIGQKHRYRRRPTGRARRGH